MASIPMKSQKRMIVAGLLVTRSTRLTGSWRPHPPTTLAGVAAVLRFANEIEDGGMEWPNTDAIGRKGWHYQLRATMAAAIEALIKAPAGKVVQS
jgi:hypothetical protein